MASMLCVKNYLYSIYIVLNIFFYGILLEAQPQEPSLTAIFYMAADNDLFPFTNRNITQMRTIINKFDDKAQKRLKIAIHLDMHRPGQPKLTKRYIIQTNQITQIGNDLCMDSGDPQSLIDCCRWAIQSCPSDEYALFLWNHGFGIIEPPIKHAVNPAQLFRYNTKTRLIELNRSISFLDFVTLHSAKLQQVRSICFDDTTGNYLTNLKLKEALQTICTRYLKGKKFAILACDACLMAMIEVISPLKEYVEFFVGSQEVELGTGYEYTSVFTPFISGFLDKRSFACHLVQVYQKTYSKITQDFTQSAINTSLMSALDHKVGQLAKLLIDALHKQRNRSVKETVRLSKHKNYCTYFDEQTYIDFGHFCINLLANLPRCELRSSADTIQFKQQATVILQQILETLNTTVIANAVGKNLAQARGLSIYFPENYIHSSYHQSIFALETQWLQFLTQYIVS